MEIGVSQGSPAGGRYGGRPLVGRTVWCQCCCYAAGCGAGWRPSRRLQTGTQSRQQRFAFALRRRQMCFCPPSALLTFLLRSDSKARHDVQALRAVHHQRAGATLWLRGAGGSARTQVAWDNKTICNFSFVKPIFSFKTLYNKLHMNLFDTRTQDVPCYIIFIQTKFFGNVNKLVVSIIDIQGKPPTIHCWKMQPSARLIYSDKDKNFPACTEWKAGNLTPPFTLKSLRLTCMAGGGFHSNHASRERKDWKKKKTNVS